MQQPPPVLSLDSDDAPRGIVLHRRAVLRRFGLFPLALLAACRSSQPGTPETNPTTTAPPPVSPTISAGSTVTVDTTPLLPSMGLSTPPNGSTGLLPACVAVPALTEGPYFVDERLERSDIRVDPTDGSTVEGIPLRLSLRVFRMNGGCTPLSGAMVDLWQCNALGIYSDVSDPQFNTVGKKFLRGYQRTDATGTVQFLTIYPGWYRGRAVHIHFKVRVNPDSAQGYEFTSQFFFDDTLTDRIHSQPPYNQKGQRDTRNADDRIFQQGGSALVLPVVEGTDELTATFAIGLAF